MTYRPDLKLKFDYMIVIHLTVLLVIYITNLCRQKIFTCYSVQRRNSGKKRRQFLCMRRRKYDVSGLLILIFCVYVHVGLDPSAPPSTCVHQSLTLSPSVWTS